MLPTLDTLRGRRRTSWRTLWLKSPDTTWHKTKLRGARPRSAAARNEARSVEPIIRTWSLVGVRVDHTGDWIDGEVEGGEAGGELVPRLGML